MKLLFNSPVIRTSPLHSSISSLRRCDTLEDLSLELDDSSSSDGDQEAEYVFPVMEEVCLTYHGNGINVYKTYRLLHKILIIG